MHKIKKLSHIHKMYAGLIVIGVLLLAILPASCTCSCNDGIGGGWKPPYDNKIAFIRKGDSNEICVMDANGANKVKLSTNTDHDAMPTWWPEGRIPAWSPDGSKIAFVGWSDINDDGRVSTYEYDLYLINADGSNQINLTYNSEVFGPLKNPIWSPDGSKIAFMGGGTVGSMAFKYDIYVMNANGSNMVNITNNDGYMYSPAWSPDGTKIAFSYDRSGEYDGIYVINDDGSGLTKISTLPYQSYMLSPLWSPDGSKLVFSANLESFSEQTEICVINADGTELTNISNNSEGADRYPCWSHNGDKITFASYRTVNGSWEIYVMNADGTDQINITNSPEDEHSPDSF